MNATTTQPLSSGKFCKLLYDTIPVKSLSADISFYNFHICTVHPGIIKVVYYQLMRKRIVFKVVLKLT